MKNLLKKLVHWLDVKFPDRMPVEEVNKFISYVKEREESYTSLLSNLVSRVEELEKKQERDVSLELLTLRKDLNSLKQILGWSSIDTIEQIVPTKK